MIQVYCGPCKDGRLSLPFTSGVGIETLPRLEWKLCSWGSCVPRSTVQTFVSRTANSPGCCKFLSTFFLACMTYPPWDQPFLPLPFKHMFCFPELCISPASYPYRALEEINFCLSFGACGRRKFWHQFSLLLFCLCYFVYFYSGTKYLWILSQIIWTIFIITWYCWPVSESSLF